MVIISFIFLAGSIEGWFNIYTTIIMIFAFLCCVGITYPNTSALSLAPFAKNAGTAAALLGALQMGVGSLVSVLVSLFKSRSSIPMAGLMTAAAALAFVILVVGRRKIVEKVESTESNVLIH
jgi:DHA1 family bicyclomycin/chloramphenicol resistance-like MFS transporter